MHDAEAKRDVMDQEK